MNDVAVVHLASASIGVAALRRFADTYREHEAGVGHQLVVAFNGCGTADRARDHLDALGPLSYEPVFLADALLDLAAYRVVAAELGERHVCFLNSTSAILHPGWLAIMDSHLRSDGVGLVGAFGSWESQFSTALARPAAHYAEGERLTRLPHGVSRKATAVCAAMRAFPRFPNHHVRTNAFMMSRARFVELSTHSLQDKGDAYRLESGRRSLTRKVLATGLSVRVTGRDGRAYAPQDWPRSRTFRSGDQSNLLVSDRRTEDYASAPLELRAALGRAAWGDAWVPYE